MKKVMYFLEVAACFLLVTGCGSSSSGTQEKDAWIPISDGETYSYLDNRGNTVVPEVKVKETSVFHGNYAVVKVGDGRERYGYLDRKGKLAIPAEYLRATVFSEGLAFVTKDYSSNDQRAPIWAIDETGKEIFQLPEGTRNVRRFSEGLAAFEKDYSWGYVNKTGSVVIEPVFTDALEFSNGLAFTKKGYIDTKGMMVIPGNFYEGSPFSSKGYAVVSTPGYSVEYGVINWKGEFVVELGDYRNLVADGDGFIAYTEDAVGRINSQGKPTIPFQYRSIMPFGGSNYAGAWLIDDDEFKIIDKKGNVAVKSQFAQMSSFRGGRAIVWHGYTAGDGKAIINEKGEIVRQLEYPADVARDYLKDGQYDSLW